MLTLSIVTKRATKRRRQRAAARAGASPQRSPEVDGADGTDDAPEVTSPALAPVEPFRRPARWAARRWLGRVFGQPLRTILVVLLWLGLMVPYVSVVATYAGYSSAAVMGFGLAVFSGIAVHVWPPRTAPWRTVAWAMVVSAFVGAQLLLLDAGRFALTGAMLTGFAIVLLRINSNGRRLVGLVGAWRRLR
jgi:hypothetical protein